MTAVVLVAVLAVGVALALVSQAYHLHADLTPEGLYTMSDAFRKELDTVSDKDITITFCADPDVLIEDKTTRVVYYMATAMALAYDNIHVETVDVIKNPNAVQAYKATSATEILWDYVIISAETGFRVRSASSFWMMQEDGETAWAYSGEYEMATVILSLLAVDKPKVYVTYGHGELSPDEAKDKAFYRMIADKLSAEVRFIDLDTEDIPADCVLLVMNGMTEDYDADIQSYEGYIPGKDNPASYLGYRSPVEKIERYLDTFGALFVLKDPFVELPVLESFLSDWGIVFRDVQVRLPRADASLRDRLTAEYATSEEHALGHSLYSAIADLPAAPPAVLERAGAMTSSWGDGPHYLSASYNALYSPVLLAGENTRGYDEDGDLVDETGGYPLAAVVNRCYTNPYDGTAQYSYVFGAGTTALVADEYIEDKAYANGEIIFSALRVMTSARTYSAMDFSINNSSYGGKILRSDEMYENDTEIYLYGETNAAGKTPTKNCLAMTEPLQTTYTVLVVLIPSLVTAALGVYFCVRRRYL